MLHETAARLADKLATVPNETNLGEELSAQDVDEQWRQIVDLGVPSFRSPGLCGIDTSGVETAIVVEQMARTLAAVPVVGQGVLVPELLEAAGAHETLEPIVCGELRVAPAFAEDLTGFASAGRKGIGFDTAGASHTLLIACSEGNRQLLAVPLRGEALAGLDLTCQLRSLPADADVSDGRQVVGRPISEDRWQRVEALAMMAVAADLVGVMQGALDDAVRYAGDRVQFGVPIGSFQAMQHLLADALIRVEGARSCVWHAAWAIDHLTANEALLAARTAKAYASAAGRDVVETTVQVFGGIAITWGHVSHIRLRRTLLRRRMFGDESLQYDAIAAMRLANPEIA